MDYLGFIAWVTSYIPDKAQVMVIDNAARPAIYFRRSQEKGFIAKSGN